MKIRKDPRHAPSRQEVIMEVADVLSESALLRRELGELRSLISDTAVEIETFSYLMKEANKHDG